MADLPYPRIAVVRKAGDERFHNKGRALPTLRLVDFWRWSVADLVANALRGMLAEYLVATALQIETTVREEWASWDLTTAGGTRIEVKSSGYLQSWAHNKLSNIIFGIAPTHSWDSASGLYARQVKRQADLYVFCLLHHRDKASVDPLDVSQWTFFVVRTTELNANFPNQKTLSHSRLRLIDHIEAGYEGLADAVAGALAH